MKEASWGEKGPDLDDTDLNLDQNYDADLDYTINFWKTWKENEIYVKLIESILDKPLHWNNTIF